MLEKDPEAVGVICFDEPENGIHPARVPAMVRLLEDIAVDSQQPISLDNPLRQVIVNTHSPLVMQEVAEEDLLCADTTELGAGDRVVRNVSFKCMPATWRTKCESPPQSIAQGNMVALLQPPRSGRVGTSGRLARPKVREARMVRTLFDDLAESAVP